MRCSYDGSVGFTLNINRLRSGVCKSCARMHLAVLPCSALDYDASAGSIELAQGIGDKSYECENLMMIGWACIGYMGLGDYPRAVRNLEAGLAIAAPPTWSGTWVRY